jgi:uncharacterized protein (TIGR03437 family)
MLLRCALTLLFLTCQLAIAQPQITTRSLPKAQLGQTYSQPLTTREGTPPYTYSAIRPLPTGLTLSPAGIISGTPTQLAHDFYDLRVTDSRNLTSTARVALSAVRGNISFENRILPPAILDSPYSAQLTATGGTPPYTFSYHQLAYPDGISLSPSGLVSGIPLIAGFAFTQIRVEDSAGNAAVAFTPIAVNANFVQFNSATLPLAILGSPYRQPIPAPQGQIVNLAYGPSLPAGLNFEENGFISGTPLEAGTYRVYASARASNFTTYGLAEFTIVVAPPFTLSSPDSFNASLANPFTASIILIGGFAPYRFELASGTLPPGLTLASSGSITGTPTQTGTFASNIRATDAGNRSAVFPFTFRITDNRLMVNLPNPIPNATLYQPFRLQPLVSGGRPPYSFTISGSPLPPGLYFNPEDGSISGTPLFFTPAAPAIQVRDNAGASETLSVTIPLTASRRLPAAQLGLAYNFNLATPNRSGYSFATEAPTGLTLAPDGAISGIPQSQGEFSFVVNSRDTNGITSSSAHNLMVVPSTRQILPFHLPAATVAETYSQTLTAPNFTPPLRWSLSQGALPAGLTLNPATGVIEGRPATTGSAPFTIQVNDATNSTRATYYFTTAPANTPRINFIGSAANYDSSGVSPGELLTAFGNGLGPNALTSFQLVNNAIPTQLANMRVWFDSLPAPILYTQANQASFIAPFAIPAFDPVRVVVEFAGRISVPMLLLPRLAKPALFTIDSSGTGPAALLNENGSINSSDNPAEEGSIIVIYLTGIGPMNPAGRDGAIATAGSSIPGTATARINGQLASILYLGNAPGLVQGVAQANLRLPPGTVSGANAITLNIGGNATTTATSVWVR